MECRIAVDEGQVLPLALGEPRLSARRGIPLRRLPHDPFLHLPQQLMQPTVERSQVAATRQVVFDDLRNGRRHLLTQIIERALRIGIVVSFCHFALR